MRQKVERKARPARKIVTINVHDDSKMIELGIRNKVWEGRDPSVWSKTNKEKAKLKKVHNHKHMHTGVASKKVIPVFAKLIIWLKKNKEFANTTYSKECWQHEIPSKLAFYGDLVSKYQYNGKIYRSDELPYWYGN